MNREDVLEALRQIARESDRFEFVLTGRDVE